MLHVGRHAQNRGQSWITAGRFVLWSVFGGHQTACRWLGGVECLPLLFRVERDKGVSVPHRRDQFRRRTSLVAEVEKNASGWQIEFRGEASHELID